MISTSSWGENENISETLMPDDEQWVHRETIRRLQWKEVGDDMLPKRALEWDQTGRRFRQSIRWTDQQIKSGLAIRRENITGKKYQRMRSGITEKLGGGYSTIDWRISFSLVANSGTSQQQM